MSCKLTMALTLLSVTLLIGCGGEPAPITSKSTSYEVADEPTNDPTPAVQAPAKQAEPASVAATQATPRRPEPMNQSSAVSSNGQDEVQATPEQLLTVIRRLREQEPTGTSQQEMIADFMRVQTQLIQAVDRLLELKPANIDIVQEAAEAKIGALTAVAQLGAEDAMDQLFAFTSTLEKHPNEKISNFGRQQSFVTLLNAYSTDQVTDTQQVIDAYKKLADEQPKEGGLLVFGRDVAGRLIEKGNNKEAAELLRHTAGLVQPTSDPQLKAAADSLVEQARFAEVDLGGKLNAVAEKKEGAIEEFTQMLGELTSGETVGVTTLQTMMQIASMLEPQHGYAAANVYEVLEASFGKSADPELAAIIKETIEKYRLRSAVVGQPFTLTGVLADGAPFDWSQYKGKVVLVDFWATWCGPCLREMPNIRANYEKYREQGFEVVGVNLDEEIQEFKDFTSLQPLAWPSVLSDDPNAVGWDHPMAAKYGVASIPFLVLVDRDGTAIALNTRGPALGEKLAELFPAAASEKPAAAKADKAAPEANEPPAETDSPNESATPSEPASSEPAPSE